jgi:hypothetical protein
MIQCALPQNQYAKTTMHSSDHAQLQPGCKTNKRCAKAATQKSPLRCVLGLTVTSNSNTADGVATLSQ